MHQRTAPILAVAAAMLLLQSGCTSGRVLRDPPPTAQKVVKELARASRSWDGNVLPPYPQGQPQVTILRITIPAGTRLDTHHHPGINAGVLLSGSLTVVTDEGKTLQLKVGDPIVEVVGTSHYGINEGKAPAEILVFYAGTVDAPVTVIDPR